MDKKKVYIAVIIFCILATGGVFYWSSQDNFSGPPPDLVPINTGLDVSDRGSKTASGGSGQVPTPEGAIEYTAPRVFPVNPKWDLSVFESSDFQTLTDYVPLRVAPEEIGRENPYQQY